MIDYTWWSLGSPGLGILVASPKSPTIAVRRGSFLIRIFFDVRSRWKNPKSMNWSIIKLTNIYMGQSITYCLINWSINQLVTQIINPSKNHTTTYYYYNYLVYKLVNQTTYQYNYTLNQLIPLQITVGKENYLKLISNLFTIQKPQKFFFPIQRRSHKKISEQNIIFIRGEGGGKWLFKKVNIPPGKQPFFLPINQFFLQKTSHPTIHEFINQTINQLTKQLIYQTNQIKVKKRGRFPMSNPQTATGNEGLNQTEYKALILLPPSPLRGY